MYVLILFDSGLSDFLFCLAVFKRPNPKEDKVDSRIGLGRLWHGVAYGKCVRFDSELEFSKSLWGLGTEEE